MNYKNHCVFVNSKGRKIREDLSMHSKPEITLVFREHTTAARDVFLVCGMDRFTYASELLFLTWIKYIMHKRFLDSLVLERT